LDDSPISNLKSEHDAIMLFLKKNRRKNLPKKPKQIFERVLKARMEE